MLNEAFDATFWDWAAYDLNWINIAAQERWLNGKGCPLDCNEANIDRLRGGLQAWLKANRPEAEGRLFDLLKILDKYRGDHGVGAEESNADTTTVCRLIREIIAAVPQLKEREITLQDWYDNGIARKVAFMTNGQAPAPVLRQPSMG